MWNRLRRSRFARLPKGSTGESVILAFAIAIFAVQRFAISRLGLDGGPATLRRVLFLATTAILVLVLLHFRRFVGAWLIAAGVVLNVVPMAAHGGLMPVAYETVRDSGNFPEITEANIGHQLEGSKDIVLRRADIHVYALSDRFALTVPGYKPNIYSAGDFAMFAGMGLVLVEGALLLAGLGHPLVLLVRKVQGASPAV
jgi:hypothetical protein